MAIPASAKAMAFVTTRDRNKAKDFYAGTLGFELTHEDDFAAVFDMNGIMLRVATVKDHLAQQHTVLGWEVADIAAAVQTLRHKGITFKVYDGLGQDELGIWSPPGGANKVAWFNDPDGNVLSLAQL